MPDKSDRVMPMYGPNERHSEHKNLLLNRPYSRLLNADSLLQHWS